MLQNLTETNGMPSRFVAFLSLDASNRKEILSAIDFSLKKKINVDIYVYYRNCVL